MIFYLGLFASVFIGISLGLIGGGGSILTMPVLSYIFGVPAVEATAYSLFIVGISSAIGSISYFRQGLVNTKTALVFGIPSIIAVSVTRKYVIPALPDTLLQIGGFSLSKDSFLLLLFAVLMIAASYSMIKKEPAKKETETDSPQRFNYPMILLEGSVVGLLTGLVGAGGGFLIIPALVILSKLPMKEAIGTSLVIVALKSLMGFAAEDPSTQIDWNLLSLVTGFAVLGIFVGMWLSKHINGSKLKPAFGWFVLVMGIYVLIKEGFFK